jgi:hypothetical protein
MQSECPSAAAPTPRSRRSPCGPSARGMSTASTDSRFRSMHRLTLDPLTQPWQDQCCLLLVNASQKAPLCTGGAFSRRPWRVSCNSLGNDNAHDLRRNHSCRSRRMLPVHVRVALDAIRRSLSGSDLEDRTTPRAEDDPLAGAFLWKLSGAAALCDWKLRYEEAAMNEPFKCPHCGGSKFVVRSARPQTVECLGCGRSQRFDTASQQAQAATEPKP